MNLDGYALPIKKLKGTEPVESLDLSGKKLGVASTIVIASLISVNSGSLTSLDLSDTQLCGVTSWGSGTYTTEGITAIADALRVNGSLTSLDVRSNYIAGNGAAQLSAAVLGNLKIEMFNEIPIKKMRANSITELDLKEKRLGVEGGMVVAGLLPVMGSLTVANLLGNGLDEESTKMLAEVAKQKGISLCGIRRDQTTADFSYQKLKPPDAILLASDLSRAGVTGSLTSLNLASNRLCGLEFRGNGTYTAEGITAISDAMRVNGSLTSLDLRSNIIMDEGVSAVCEAIQSNKETKLTSLNFRKNYIGPVGANAVAAMVVVTGALTRLVLKDNNIGPQGAKYLSEALKTNKSVTELDISNRGGSSSGDMKAEGAKYLAEMLSVNGSLTKME